MSMRVVSARRPICAAEVFTVADTLRRTRAVEFSLPQSIAVAEVSLLHYLRDHGAFVQRHGTSQAAAKVLLSTVDAIRDLCSVPIRTNNNGENNNNNQQQQQRCVLTDNEILQLVDLRVMNEVDLYKVVPDIDLRLGGEAKVAPLIALLKQLK